MGTPREFLDKFGSDAIFGERQAHPAAEGIEGEMNERRHGWWKRS
jgi:hypothetical protein